MVRNVNGLTRGTLFAGLVAVLVNLGGDTAWAQAEGLPDDRLGQSTAPLLLLSRADVRADLRLTPQQTKDAEQAIIDLYTRALALKGKKGPGAVAARKVIDQEQIAWIETHLSTEQQARLVQVDLWWEGPSALVTRPVVSDTVGLTVEQRATLRAAVDVRNAARAKKSFSMADEDRLWQKTKATLSSTQLERWKAMLGQAFHPRVAFKE